MYTDPIADFLTRVRNAIGAGHRVVEVPASKLKKEMTKILFDQGYILSYQFNDESVQGSIKIALKYDRATKESVIRKFKEYQHQVYVSTLVRKKFQEYLTDWGLLSCLHRKV